MFAKPSANIRRPVVRYSSVIDVPGNRSGVAPAATCGRFAVNLRQLCGQKARELPDGIQVLNLELPNRYT